MAFFSIRPNRERPPGFEIPAFGKIRLFIEPGFLLFMGLIFFLTSQRGFSPNQSVLICFVFFFSVLAHEAGHALAARLFGYRDISISIVMFGGLTRHPPTSRGHGLLITLAGPLASVLLAAAAWMVWGRVTHPGVVFLSNKFLFLNLFWAVLNMLPIYPMDGGQSLIYAFSYFIPNHRALLWVAYISIGISVLVGFFCLKIREPFILIFMFMFVMQNLEIIRSAKS